MRKAGFFMLVCFLSSCSPRISTIVNKPLDPINYKEEILVFGLNQAVPQSCVEIGIVKIGDTGFTTNCGWELVVEKAKMEARKAGGNAIKITEHIPPSILGSTCHRITAKILRVDHFDPVNTVKADQDTVILFDYALLHFYRHPGAGSFVSYDLHLGDSVICRARNNWKETIKLNNPGQSVLWAQTEAKVQLPLEMKKGKEYYIRCGVSVGFFVGHPILDLIDNQTGLIEYQLINKKQEQYEKLHANDKAEIKDLLVLNSEDEIPCKIAGEDSENVYFIVLKNNREIRTSLNKKSIKEIKRGAL